MPVYLHITNDESELVLLILTFIYSNLNEIIVLDFVSLYYCYIRIEKTIRSINLLRLHRFSNLMQKYKIFKSMNAYENKLENI